MDDWLSAAARRRPHHPYLVTPAGTWSFDDVETRAARVAGGLHGIGIDVGERVGVRGRNDVEAVIAVFGLGRAGAVPVLLDPRWTEDEVRTRMAAAGVRKVLGDGVAGVPGVGYPEGDPVPGEPPEPDRLHSVVFTSGSSGEPRGVRITWANLEAAAEASAAHLAHRPDDRWLCVLPLHHIGGLSILVRSAREATTVLLEPRFDAVRAARALSDGSATLASVVATMLARILDVESGPFRGVRAVLVGGGPVPVDLLRRATAAGLPALATYGMTETAAQVATARTGDDPTGRLFALAGVEIDLDRLGRIRVRGPMVSPGYVDDGDRSAGDWLVTADLGVLDEEGGLLVIGRADDVIVTGGENVHPAEVEAVLRDHPGVEEVVVVGLPDEDWGSVVAAVYRGPATAEELERHARRSLAGFKVPRRWRRVESVPQLGIGKVDRAAVRRLLAASAESDHER